MALVPGFAVISLHAASVAVVGSSSRYHHPPDPLMHVVAFGGVLLLARLSRALVARFGPQPVHVAHPLRWR